MQDPSTAERTEMPEAALAVGPNAVIDLDGMASVLCVVCDTEGVV